MVKANVGTNNYQGNVGKPAGYSTHQYNGNSGVREASNGSTNVGKYYTYSANTGNTFAPAQH